MPTPQKETRLGTGSGKVGSNGQRRNSVLDRIQAIGFGEDQGIKMLLYGTSGTGKTTLWATFPKPILAVICSGGRKGGELRSVDTPENRKSIDQVHLHDSGELKDIVEFIKETGKYKTVVLDHATGFSDLVLKEVLGIEQLPAQKSWGMATREQYGQSTLQCKEQFKLLLDLDCNVVIIAHEREFSTEGLEGIVTPTIGASMSPTLATWLNGAVDYMGQTFKRNKVIRKKVKKLVKGKPVEKVVEEVTKDIEYCLRAGPDTVFHTKFRVPKEYKVPKVIVDPDYSKIAAVIRGLREQAQTTS